MPKHPLTMPHLATPCVEGRTEGHLAALERTNDALEGRVAELERLHAEFVETVRTMMAGLTPSRTPLQSARGSDAFSAPPLSPFPRDMN